MTVPAILAVAVTYGAASIAATQATFLPVAGAAPVSRDRRFQQEMARMIVTLVVASAGALLESRGVELLEVILFAVVLTALAAAVMGGVTASDPPSTLPFYLGVGAATIVAASSLAQGLWPTVLWGVLCALPFALSAFFYPRASAIDDAIFAAIAGALLSLFSAMFVIFLACLTSIGIANLRKAPSRGVRFYPYIAAYSIAGIVIQFALIG